MNNKEKYVGKIVDIYAPFGGRKLDTLEVLDIIDDDHIYGKSQLSQIETSYSLSDGIQVEIKN